MNILRDIQRKYESILTLGGFGRFSKDRAGAPDRLCQFGHKVFSGDRLCSYGHRPA